MKPSVFRYLAFFFLLFFSCGPGKERTVLFHTSMGDIHLCLFNDTPRHREYFIEFAESLARDTLLFNRILRDQLIQFGTTKSVPSDRPEQEIKAPLCSGALAMSAASIDPAFFIVQGRPQTDSTLTLIEKKLGIRFTPSERRSYTKYGGLPQLHGRYTVFGQVKEGMDVVDRIAALPRDTKDRPLEDVWVRVVISP